MCLYDINFRKTLFLCQMLFETENKTLKDNIANTKQKQRMEWKTSSSQYHMSHMKNHWNIDLVIRIIAIEIRNCVKLNYYYQSRVILWFTTWTGYFWRNQLSFKYNFIGFKIQHLPINPYLKCMKNHFTFSI